MITQSQLNEYLDYNKNRWSKTTLKSEASRLKNLLELYNKTPQSPLELYNELSKTKKPYTVKTSFTTLAKFLEFLGVESPYRTFLKDHAKLFKTAYKREELDLSFEEAERRIKLIPNVKVREHCLGLLYTGLRAHEASKVDGGKVIGKGQKERNVFGKCFLLSKDIPYVTIYTNLKRVGLKPHSLRKLFATKLIDNGLGHADLCKVMGWNSFATAERYLQAKTNKELGNIIDGL